MPDEIETSASNQPRVITATAYACQQEIVRQRVRGRRRRDDFAHAFFMGAAEGARMAGDQPRHGRLFRYATELLGARAYREVRDIIQDHKRHGIEV